jgi:hypothetical protein
LDDAARDEAEAVEIVALDRARPDRTRLAQTLAIARTNRVAGEEHDRPVGLDLVHGDGDVGVGLVEFDPRRQLEEAGDVGVRRERRRVVRTARARLRASRRAGRSARSRNPRSPTRPG